MSRKPQPWFASLNLPPWSPRNGRNRKPNPSTHHNPPDRTSPPNDGADALTYADWSVRAFDITIRPKPPAIPHAGIRAGELTGYRMWLVLGDNRLCSLAHHFVWEPNAVITGNVDEVVEDAYMFGCPPIFGGVYSYSSADKIILASEASGSIFPTQITFGSLFAAQTGYRDIHHIYGIVSGTIKCWGEVVEHERGYRAQYAKLTSIDDGIGCIDPQALRSKYNV